MLFEADYAKNYASILYQCLLAQLEHQAHTPGCALSFSSFVSQPPVCARGTSSNLENYVTDEPTVVDPESPKRLLQCNKECVDTSEQPPIPSKTTPG